MRRQSNIWLAFGLLLGLGFLAGLARLLVLRFEAGDVYPPYSSLRSDPLGTRAFHDSLALLPNTRVSRNFEPLSRYAPEPGATLFLLGLTPDLLESLDEDDWRLFRGFASRGARVVLAVGGSLHADRPSVLARFLREPATPSSTNAAAGVDGAASARGFRIERRPAGPDAIAEQVRAVPGLPGILPWSGALVFDGLTGAWQAVYARSGGPVLIESRMGRGSLVVSADAYLFSNEALSLERRPELLAWIAGNARTLVFDETHLGLSETPGIAKFIARYRLGGWIVGLLLLAGLSLWRQLAVFLPAALDEAKADDRVQGRDSLSGLAALLAGRVPRRRLLRECVEAWNRAAAGQGPARHPLPCPAEPDEARPSAAEVLREYERLRKLAQERKLRA
jgi:hypothetical protein